MQSWKKQQRICPLETAPGEADIVEIAVEDGTSRRGANTNWNQSRGNFIANANANANRGVNNGGPIICNYCKERNHIARDCRARLNDMRAGNYVNQVNVAQGEENKHVQPAAHSGRFE